LITMTRFLALLVALSFTFVVSTPARADPLPTGQRAFGQATVEPAYDAAHAGRLIYLLTPDKAPDPVKANPRSWAPIYIPVYPAGSTAAATFSCSHTPIDNCPDHGYLVAGAAQQISQAMGFGDVYAGGVLGHDHVADAPGGDDFNIAWEPVIVLFTSAAAANQHLVTDAAILDAQQRDEVVLVPAPTLTFDCAVVSATTYNHGTPVV
jgi:hypothetical protein